ncbi:hypothetical protein PYW07_008132 [Mythimna separata]|uniref:FP protein C-terminal domain-containing protein n=1 Tax=Mythimna separata TaxID=271217 RepID=A0AAD7YQZ6_MYTSE|nr:hypothetical protein PYW07_008132 [Mythimna separata]
MMKRTPPRPGNDPFPPHSSEPDLTSPMLDQTLDRITLRQKRKHDSEQTLEIKSLREDIMSSLETLSKEQNEKFSIMQCNLDQIKAQNIELKNTVEFLSGKYDDVMIKLTLLENEKRSTLQYIGSLEEKIENMERNAKSSCLEIRNVPKTPNESKEVLIDIVRNLGTAVNTEIQACELRDVYRLTSSSKPQTNGSITAEFTTTMTKDKLLTNIKKYNRDNKTNRLNSSHVKMAGNSPIYISESLTTKAKKLFYLAREFTKQNGYAYHWTSHGKVFVKKEEGAPARRISQESDFERLKPQEK